MSDRGDVDIDVKDTSGAELLERAQTLGSRVELLATLKHLAIRASLLGYLELSEAIAWLGVGAIRGLDFELQQLLRIFSPYADEPGRKN